MYIMDRHANADSDFNLPAQKLRFFAMSNEKLSKILDIEIKEWEEELREFVNNC